MNIDFSNFKKIDESDKHATLEHPSGHHLKIAKKGLSEELRKQLEEMPVNLAKGGYAKYAQKYDPNVKKQIYQQRPGHGIGPEAAGISQVSQKSQPSKDPSYNEPRDMGTDQPATGKFGLPKLQPKPVAEWNVKEKAGKAVYPPCINPSCKSYGHSHPNCRCYGGVPETGRFAEGGSVEKEYYCDTDRPHFKSCELYKDGGEVQKFAEKGMVESEGDKLEKVAQDVNAEQQDMPPADMSDQSSQPVPSPLPPPVNPNAEMSSQPNQAPPMAPDQNQQAPQAPQDQQYPDPFAGSSPTPAPVSNFSDAQSFKRYHMDDMMNQQNAYEQELDSGEIKPEHYFHLFSGNKDEHGKPTVLAKIGSAFGLMLGGIGSGLTGQPNQALQVMQNEIKNNLEAQKNSVANKQNFLKINQQGLMNRAQIDQMDQESAIKSYAQSQTQMNVTAYHNLVQDVNKIPANTQQGIEARQKLAMMWPAVQQANLGIMDKAASAAAFQNMLMGTEPHGMAPSADPEASFQRRTNALRMLGPDGLKKAEDLQSKHMPGLPGQASDSLTPGDKDDLRKGMVFDKAMNDLTSWTKAHPNGAIPESPEDQRGRALAGIVQGGFRGATNGGVYKSGEQDFINKLVPEDPTKAFNSYRVLPKLQAVQKEMASQLDAKARTFGFQGYPGLQQQQEVHPQEGKIFINPKTGQRGTFKNGKWVTM